MVEGSGRDYCDLDAQRLRLFFLLFSLGVSWDILGFKGFWF